MLSDNPTAPALTCPAEIDDSAIMTRVTRLTPIPFDMKNGHRLIDSAGLDRPADQGAISQAAFIAEQIALNVPNTSSGRSVAVLNSAKEEIGKVPINRNDKGNHHGGEQAGRRLVQAAHHFCLALSSFLHCALAGVVGRSPRERLMKSSGPESGASGPSLNTPDRAGDKRPEARI
jgi:hypothetical protein